MSIEIGSGDNWMDSSQEAVRPNLGEKPLTFANKFLDMAFRGIFKDDLILFGAPTGVGKTQFSTNIAVQNVMQGKRVHFIALESSIGEINNRIRYANLANFYFMDGDRQYTDRKLNFPDWLLGRFDGALAKYLPQAKAAQEELKNLHIHYGSNSFTVTDLLKLAADVAGETDLIIVDHVHYFDLNDHKNENTGLKEIAQSARNITQNLEAPMLLIGHMRKKDKRSPEICPSMDEFHGSSDLSKIATKVVTMSGGPMVPGESTKSYSYLRILKNRFDGSVTKFGARMIYNFATTSFDDHIDIGKFTDFGAEFEIIEEKIRKGHLPEYNPEYPYWAKEDEGWSS